MDTEKLTEKTLVYKGTDVAAAFKNFAEPRLQVYSTVSDTKAPFVERRKRALKVFIVKRKTTARSAFTTWLNLSQLWILEQNAR